MKCVFQEYRRQCVDKNVEKKNLNFQVSHLCVPVCISLSHSPLHHQPGTLPALVVKVIIVIHLAVSSSLLTILTAIVAVKP